MVPSIPARLAGAALSLMLLAGCAGSTAPGVGMAEPANLGQVKREVTRYQESGAYDRDLAAVAAEARAWVETRAGQVERPAIVLDIDETSLSNWRQLKLNDFGYLRAGGCDLERGPCAAPAWEDMGIAPPIRPVLELFRAARARGVAVFFITGRRENQRAGTEKNLRDAGFEGWAGVAMRPAEGPRLPAAEFKSAARAGIEAQGYRIIANVGDQASDLEGGHAEKAFKLPNPFYVVD